MPPHFAPRATVASTSPDGPDARGLLRWLPQALSGRLGPDAAAEAARLVGAARLRRAEWGRSMVLCLVEAASAHGDTGRDALHPRSRPEGPAAQPGRRMP